MYSYYGSSITIVGGSSYSNFDNDEVKTTSNHGLTLGKKTVQGPVKAGHSATLNRTTVQGNDNSVRSGHSMTLNGVSAGDVKAGHSANISSSNLGNIKSGHGCNISETNAVDVSAGHKLEAEECPSLRNVSAGHGMSIKDCPQVSSVKAGHALSVQNCNVLGDAKAGHEARVKNSKIGGTLSFSCGDKNSAKLENVVCPKVVITYKKNICVSNVCISGGVFFGGGIQNNQKQITLPEKYTNYGVSQVISGDSSFTLSGRTVSYSGNTRNIIINGERLYDLIQRYGEANEPKEIEKLPEIVLTLCGNCEIGEVVFNGAKGKVICSDGNEFKGIVHFS